MDLPCRETHLQSAKALYRQRLGWLDLPVVAMPAMLDLEHRLRVHLHVLSRSVDPDEGEPGEAPDLFVHLAARLAAPDEALRKAAVELACEKLAEPGPMAEAARDALVLFPRAESQEILQAAFREAGEARLALLDIMWAHGMSLPPRFFEPANLTALPPDVHAAALHHAARNPETRRSLFQPYYLLVALDDGADRTPPDVLRAALQAGLVLGDPDAPDAARTTLERETDLGARGALLRLLALAGDPGVVGLLKDHIDFDPPEALALLALHGGRRAVQRIVDALDDPRCAQAAAEAWTRVSGETLPRKPRLSVVGAPAADGGSAGELPEAGPARASWRLKAPGLAGADRWHGGERLSVQGLVDRLQAEAGAQSLDRLDLLAVLLGRPVDLHPRAWHAQRIEVLRRLQSSDEPARGVNPGARAHA